MRVVPRPNAAAIAFYEIHAPLWQAGAPSIGLTPPEADEVADLAADARAAYAAQQQAMQAARDATLECELAVARLRAAAVADPGVYAAASLPVPAAPAPIPAPGTPSDFDAQFLGNTGILRLTWACKNPRGAAGTMYEIWRNDDVDGGGAAGGVRFIALAGEKRFVDATLPAGTPAVEYQVTAVRSTRRGQPARYRVSFGTARAAA